MMRPGDDKELFKQAIREATDDWLNAQFSRFGKWTFYGIMAAVFVGMVKYVVTNKLF